MGRGVAYGGPSKTCAVHLWHALLRQRRQARLDLTSGGCLPPGARPGDPALRLACRWLLDRQQEDGGWGEHHSGCLTGRYVAGHEESQVIQTAWAIDCAPRGGRCELDRDCAGCPVLAQHPGGGWDMAQARHGPGSFSARRCVDYVLYRQYFPLHALGLYEQRRQARLDLTSPRPRAMRRKPPT